MNTYIANFIDSSCTSFELYSYNNGLISSEHFLDIAELKNLDDSSQVVVLIPSILITSYQNSKNLALSEDINLANFISDIDTKIVDQISHNEFLFHGNNAFIVNKVILEDLNKALTQLDNNIILMPEYSFFKNEYEQDVIFELNNKFIFSNSDGTGTAVSSGALEQYCQMISDLKVGYNPLIYSDNKFLKEKKDYVEQCLKNKKPTIPTTISEEIKTNIFFRFNDPDVEKAINLENSSELEIFTKLRDLKDNF